MLCEDFKKVSEVINQLGTINKNDRKLKQMARVGQNFSSTTKIKQMRQKEDPKNLKQQTFDENNLPENSVFEVPDIPSDYVNVPFTDGAGNISESLAS